MLLFYSHSSLLVWLGIQWQKIIFLQNFEDVIPSISSFQCSYWEADVILIPGTMYAACFFILETFKISLVLVFGNFIKPCPEEFLNFLCWALVDSVLSLPFIQCVDFSSVPVFRKAAHPPLSLLSSAFQLSMFCCGSYALSHNFFVIVGIMSFSFLCCHLVGFHRDLPCSFGNPSLRFFCEKINTFSI